MEGAWDDHEKWGRQFKVEGVAASSESDASDSVNEFKKVGLTGFEIRVLIDTFGSFAYGVIEKNPYRAMWCDRIGFVRADKIARKFKMDSKDPRRAVGAAVWSLVSASRDGHCFLSLGQLVTSVQRVTGIHRDRVMNALREHEFLPDNVTINGETVEWYRMDDGKVWLSSCERLEKTIATWLVQYRKDGDEKKREAADEPEPGEGESEERDF